MENTTRGNRTGKEKQTEQKVSIKHNCPDAERVRRNNCRCARKKKSRTKGSKEKGCRKDSILTVTQELRKHGTPAEKLLFTNKTSFSATQKPKCAPQTNRHFTNETNPNKTKRIKRQSKLETAVYCGLPQSLQKPRHVTLKWHQIQGGRRRRRSLTVGFEAGGFTVAAPCLVDGLDKEDVTGAALQAVHCVVVLFDVGYNHPAVCRVVQTCRSHTDTQGDHKWARGSSVHAFQAGQTSETLKRDVSVCRWFMFKRVNVSQANTAPVCACFCSPFLTFKKCLSSLKDAHECNVSSRLKDGMVQFEVILSSADPPLSLFSHFWSGTLLHGEVLLEYFRPDSPTGGLLLWIRLHVDAWVVWNTTLPLTALHKLRLAPGQGHFFSISNCVVSRSNCEASLAVWIWCANRGPDRDDDLWANICSAAHANNHWVPGFTILFGFTSATSNSDKSRTKRVVQ